MVCPECGADHSFAECAQPGTPDPTTLTPSELILEQTAQESTALGEEEFSVAKPTSRLIEFPGVTRRTVPPWRRELSERVREVQERRAQEAAAEGEATNPVSADAANVPPQLELLPQAEALAVNPLVVAALRRIERAHQPGHDFRPSHPAVLSAAVGTTDAGTARHELRQDNGTSRLAVSAILFDEPCNETETATFESTENRNPVAVATVPDSKEFSLSEIEPEPEPPVNLAVVPPAPVPPAPIVGEANTSAEADSAPDVATTKPKPKRIISDDASDPALNYLDLIGVASPKEVDRENRAPVFSRLMAGVIDLLSVGFLSVPFAAVIELRNDNWREPRVALFMASVAIVVMFIYLTMTTALTGKTLGMRILSLRVIDTRTRLIPTGKQAAGRAIVYILSLATAGVGFLVALARGEGKTVHDRLSRTAVVRD